MQLLARTLRYLANRYLSDPHNADRDGSSQKTARTNAAEASATLRKRRCDHEDVEAYLQAQRLSTTPDPEGEPEGHATEHAV